MVKFLAILSARVALITKKIKKMKSKSFIFLLLTLVSFLSCDPPVPRPDRTPFCIAEPQMPTWQLDLRNAVKLNSQCDSLESILYVHEINDLNTYIPDGLGGEWLLVTKQDTAVSLRQCRTTFYYRKYKDPLHVRVTEFFTTHLCTSQFYTAEKEGR